MNTDAQCCAVRMTGSDTYQGMECGLVPTDVADSVNVSDEYRMICIFAVTIQSLMLTAACCYGSETTGQAAACLHCLACMGSLAWIITLTVFVFRDEGKACNGTGDYGTLDPTWYQSHHF